MMFVPYRCTLFIPIAFFLLFFVTLLRTTTTAADVSSSTSESNSSSSNALITNLPGLHYDPGFRLYSGYVSIPDNQRNGNNNITKNIFYLFVESERNPSKDPVVFWTNGGPGCSGLIGFGIEHGPFIIGQNGTKLSLNIYSWNKFANMLYVEQPAGVGFSYSTTSGKTHEDYNYTSNDAQATHDNYIFIHTWLLEHFPAFQSNDFYIASESYGGHYMPQLTKEILNRNKDQLINFKGMMVGNPGANRYANTKGRYETFYGRGLLPWPTYKPWVETCAPYPNKYMNKECREIRNAMEEHMKGNGINIYALDYPLCIQSMNGIDTSTHETSKNEIQLPPKLHSSSSSSQASRFLEYYYHDDDSDDTITLSAFPSGSYQPCSESYLYQYLNRLDVQKALHVTTTTGGNSNKAFYWTACSTNLNYNKSDVSVSQVGLYKELTRKALNDTPIDIMIYSGDDDSLCSTAGTQYWLWELGLNTSDSKLWQPWMVDNQTAGFVTEFELGTSLRNNSSSAANRGSFVFATVHGAGHEVPAYRPKEAVELFRKYLNREW